MSRRARRGRRSQDTEVAVTLARARAAAGLAVAPDVLDAGTVPPRDRAVWSLAHRLGVPLAPVLDDLHADARARDRLAAEVRRASAEGRTVAFGLVCGPPVLGLLTAGLVTDDPVAVLAGGAGRVLVAVAAVLWVFGVTAVVLAVRHAARVPPAGDELLVLVRVALVAGLSLPAALRAAADELARGDTAGQLDAGGARRLALWFDLGCVGRPPPAAADVAPVLHAAVLDGIPLAPLLDELAGHRRRAAHDVALERAARLGARLSVPTALLLLPAGLLLAAGPLLLSAMDQLTHVG